MPTLRSSRLVRALARQGLDLTIDGSVLTVRTAGDPHAVPARILLPADLPLEGKAARQLATLGRLRHPDGGRAVAVAGTPDLHPGDSGVAIGSVLATEGLVLPAAVGSDIHCGMRLHVVDLPVERFLAERDGFVADLVGDFFYGARDVTMAAATMRALFSQGLLGWLDALRDRPSGCMAAADVDQVEAEAERVMGLGSLGGAVRWAPHDLVPEHGWVRDGGLGTIGGGNHFVEVQHVAEVVDRAAAFHLGVREGQLAVMIHSGSRNVGKHIGGWWRDRCRALWPEGVAHPPGRLFALSETGTPDEVTAYLEAEATGGNYAFVNRALLAELLRARLRQRFGDVEAPLVVDVSHNLTRREGDRWVARKGACPAGPGEPVVVPGSMGSSSWLATGGGDETCLCSASHGAGRATSRFAMARTRRGGRHSSDAALGLEGVDCVTPRAERRVEEAPAAYKPIASVIEVQQRHGVLSRVARLEPVLTFKA